MALDGVRARIGNFGAAVQDLGSRSSKAVAAGAGAVYDKSTEGVRAGLRIVVSGIYASVFFVWRKTHPPQPPIPDWDVNVSLRQVLSQIKPGQVNLQTVLHDNTKNIAQTCQAWIDQAQQALAAPENTDKPKSQRIQVEKQIQALKSHAATRPDQVNEDEDSDPEATTDLNQSITGLSESAQLYTLKAKYGRLFPNNGHRLSSFEKSQLQHLADRYPEYARLLIKRNPETAPATDGWTEDFFKFCLRSPALSIGRNKDAKHWIEIFIKYPDQASEIMRTHLDKRLGQYPENISIEGRGLCLKIDVDGDQKWVPIQKSSDAQMTVPLRNRVNPNAGPLVLSIHQIFQQFKAKTWGYGDLEMCEDGIVNWNSIKLGSLDPARPGNLDLINPKEWHKALPILTLDYTEFRKLYSGQVHKEPKYGFVLRANREFDDPNNVSNTHGFFDFVYRMEDGRYRVVPTGFQATHLPSNLWEKFCQLTDTEESGVHMPDEGHSLTQRKQEKVFYELSEAEGDAVIDLIAKEISKCREGTRYFQANGKNCAYIVQRVVDKVLGKSFYDMLQVQAVKQLGSDAEAQNLQKLQYAYKSLDPQAFVAYVQPIISEMVKLNRVEDVHVVIEESFKTLNRMLRKKGAEVLQPPGIDAVRAAFVAQGENKKDITDSLVKLTEIVMDVLHPYRMPTFEGIIDAPGVGHVFRGLKSIRWEWLRNLITDVLLFLIGSWRWHNYEKTSADGAPAVRKWSSLRKGRHAGRYINLPAKLFQNCSKEGVAAKSNAVTEALAVFSAPTTSEVPPEEPT